MSRAVRRQQAPTAPPETGGGGRLRPFGPKTSRQKRGARAPQQPRRGLRLKAPGWVSEIWSELKKVTWPTRDETAYLTMVVIVVAVAVGIVLGGIDIFFNWLIDQVLLS
jgi:preprotein translocase subunit SecE